MSLGLTVGPRPAPGMELRRRVVTTARRGVSAAGGRAVRRDGRKGACLAPRPVGGLSSPAVGRRHAWPHVCTPGRKSETENARICASAPPRICESANLRICESANRVRRTRCTATAPGTTPRLAGSRRFLSCWTCGSSRGRTSGSTRGYGWSSRGTCGSSTKGKPGSAWPAARTPAWVREVGTSPAGNHPGRGALGALRPSQLSCLI